MESETELDTRKLVYSQNRKKKKSGGFQSMGLSQAIFRGVIKKGYKVPTPIQRKCIPVVMEGKDVVAMARTGSGKTAAFLIPMFEKLQTRSAKTGARALIFSPTRELALQTFKFTKELGKFTGLKATLVLGGDRMEDQFAAIHENPDILIATPGRFLHVLVEMDLKLSSVEYVVFDEADRLFEMGFAEQLREVLHRLPENRQSVLFSATLPRMLADFAKAGLNDPSLIRLDVDSKLSDQLKMAFLACRSEDKVPILLHLLTTVIPRDQLTVVFAPTKHHVEYLNMVLTHAGISVTYLYSNLDQTARKINVANFHSRKAHIMLVTDVAARGIDIPMLDNVVNFSCPPKAKLFVHRVGRVARAGRSGVAYTLVSPDEAPYILDLHLFLGRPMKYSSGSTKRSDWDGVYGTVPRSVVEEEEERLQLWHNKHIELASMKRVCANAYMQYLKSRPNPSTESVRRMKEDLQINTIAVHQVYGTELAKQNNDAALLLEQVKAYKPHSTIFEINATAKTPASAVMRQVRRKYNRAIETHHQKREEKLQHQEEQRPTTETAQEDITVDDAVEEMFSTVVRPRKRAMTDRVFEPKRKKKKGKESSAEKNAEYYVPYKPTNHYSERGLEVEKSAFEQQAAGEILDLTGDEMKTLKNNTKQMKWDRKKKKFVNMTGKETHKKRIKTESGVWIPATYKSDLYKKWKQRQKVDSRDADDDSDAELSKEKLNRNMPHFKKYKKSGKVKGPEGKPPKKELRSKEEIVKQRKRKQKIEFQQKRRQLEKSKRKTRLQKSSKRKR